MTTKEEKLWNMLNDYPCPKWNYIHPIRSYRERKIWAMYMYPLVPDILSFLMEIPDLSIGKENK